MSARWPWWPTPTTPSCSARSARARADGAAVGVCVLCRGDKGQPAEPVADLAAVRRREMTAAAAVLGTELFRGDFGDGELADGPKPQRKLIRIYRAFGHVGPGPRSRGLPHRPPLPAALAEAVSWFAASKGHVTREPALAAQPALWRMDTVPYGYLSWASSST